MKLELKHLAPYLPYGLECITTTGVRGKMIMISNTEVFLDCKVKWNSGAPYNWMLSMDIKPILRPLSDVDDDLFKEIGFADEDDFIECVINGDILYNNFVKLVSRHFDVFNLIPAGLAIDINMQDHA